MIQYFYEPDHYFWFRLLGYGFALENRVRYPAPFSIRMGIQLEYRFGKYALRFLTPRG